jgi:acyl-CoA reductase-like NAD-dependent aldehyde dehydrogenase
MWAIASVFRDAGLPDGVLNFIACTPAAAPGVVKALVDSPLVKKINFTGSTRVGRAIG